MGGMSLWHAGLGYEVVGASDESGVRVVGKDGFGTQRRMT